MHVRLRRRVPVVVALLLLIEFLDEVVFSVIFAAWPLIRDDLSLSYTEIGLVLSLPNISSAILEPPMALAGDSRWRRRIVLGGGVAYAGGLLLLASADGFAMLLVAFLVLYPASGAFVSLSQASLVDTNPDRAEQLMARWNLAGSIGVVAGPIALGAASLAGLDWRWTTVMLAVYAAGLVAVGLRRFPAPQPKAHDALPPIASLKAALRRATTWRWLTLLAFADLMFDVLFGFLALYVVDVAGGSARVAGLAVFMWVSVGLVGDFLVLPVLERFRGLSYLRVSAVVTTFLYSAFLARAIDPCEAGAACTPGARQRWLVRDSPGATVSLDAGAIGHGGRYLVRLRFGHGPHPRRDRHRREQVEPGGCDVADDRRADRAGRGDSATGAGGGRGGRGGGMILTRNLSEMWR